LNAARRIRLLSPVAGVLSGLLFALAFPPFEWVLLAPLALVPWIVVLAREESRSRALYSGFLFGLVFWCASIPWIAYVVTHYGGQSGPMGVLCLLLSAAYLAQWPAVAAWGTVACATAGSVRRLAVFPLLWMASEHARSYVYGGFPWNLTGHALYRHPVWLQSASVWGVYGIGLLVAAVASLLSAAVLGRRLAPALVAGLAVLLVGGFGVVQLSLPTRPALRFSVALLQPNTTEEMRAAPGGAARAYAAVISQAREAALTRPELIVFPESALPVYWARSELLRRDLLEIASGGSAVLFNDVEEEPDGRYFNVARLLGPGGLAGRPYRKVHLVPFGEYVPLPKVFFFVRQISSEVGAFSSADRPVLIEAGALKIGIGLCYEIIYPALARSEVAQGANLLATISNDSWYGRAGAQAQHFAGATLRAVETRRYLLRAAITGISGIVDEKGRIRAELGEGRAGILRGTASLFHDDTAWTRWGFWLPRAADVLAAAVLLFGLVRWLRFRRLKAES
jgi:apolipoprotein N-acyltransferase